MKNDTKYFRNKYDMDYIAKGTLWLLNGRYVQPLNKQFKLKVFYKPNEHWYYEVENPIESQDKKC